MHSRDFCYWLQGFFEITGTKKVIKEQLDMIKKHLDYVFQHDPSIAKDWSQKVEALSYLEELSFPQSQGVWPNPSGLTTVC